MPAPTSLHAMKSPKRATHSPAASPDALPPEVRPGQSVELLKQLHILTREGKLNQDSRRKLKQVYHLFQFIEKLLLELPASDSGPTLADHGAGKSYLGFIIYDLFFKALGQGTIYGIETRSELVESSKALAQKLGFERMRFLNVSVAESTQSAELPEQIDVVTALHACDTATDEALAKGVQSGAPLILVSPCCHREVRPQLSVPEPLAGPLRHGIFRERHAEFATDALRALLLEWAGYETRVFEFISTEHTGKNLMIAAIRRKTPGDTEARARAVAEFARFHGIVRQRLAERLGFDLMHAAAPAQGQVPVQTPAAVQDPIPNPTVP